MLNFADLCALLTLLGAGITGAFAAHSEHATGWTALLFAGMGIGIGILVAKLFGRLAYAVLFYRTNRYSPSVACVVGCACSLLSTGISLLSVAVAAVTTVFLTEAILRLFH